MRKLLLTTAVALPLALGPVYAQDAAITPPPETAGDATADTTTSTPGEAAAATDDVDKDAMVEAEAGAADAAADAADSAADAASDAAAAAESTADATAEAAAEPEVSAEAAEQAALEAEMASSDKVVHEQAANELRLDWITGTSVTSASGDNVGDIRDIIFDGNSGQVIAAIVGVGGFLGIGEKQIAVPWDQLTINFDAQEITTALTKEEAEAAPEFVFRERKSAPAAEMPAADPAAVPADPAAMPADTAVDPAAMPAEGEAAAEGEEPASN